MLAGLSLSKAAESPGQTQQQAASDQKPETLNAEPLNP
jgi:hypothetical protein